MTKLDYSFTDDMLFKMVFVRHPDLLIRLVVALLGIRPESIEQFDITNSEILPEAIGDKFCRLDINMVIDGQRVDLEIQVRDEGDYPERSLYYWAREYSGALTEGKKYEELPRAIVMSIVAFDLFDCVEFYSEFQALETTRHELLTDKMRLCYFELLKLPKIIGADDELKLWLSLFKAKTEEDLQRIQALGVPIMEQAIEAYRHTKAMDEFKELERLRSRARHNEASALYHAERKAEQAEREKWQAVVAEKDASHAAALAEKAAEIADKNAEIAELRSRLGEDK
ncbi:MAG: Rpn family recombination-promoting nuclease/putative transposase [Spirochaetota bacterium]|jgi:predicted transposase/invertase (TIGR01784 family)|nr:Rpn family recombination-promoting nuclease/putative transposase [Spirochaetota bacterium]